MKKKVFVKFLRKVREEREVPVAAPHPQVTTRQEVTSRSALKGMVQISTRS